MAAGWPDRRRGTSPSHYRRRFAVHLCLGDLPPIVEPRTSLTEPSLELVVVDGQAFEKINGLGICEQPTVNIVEVDRNLSLIQPRIVTVGNQAVSVWPKRFANVCQTLAQACAALCFAAVAPQLVLQPPPGPPLAGRGRQERQKPFSLLRIRRTLDARIVNDPEYTCRTHMQSN